MPLITFKKNVDIIENDDGMNIKVPMKHGPKDIHSFMLTPSDVYALNNAWKRQMNRLQQDSRFQAKSEASGAFVGEEREYGVGSWATPSSLHRVLEVSGARRGRYEFVGDNVRNVSLVTRQNLAPRPQSIWSRLVSFGTRRGSTIGDSATATYMTMARSSDPTYRSYGLRKLRERGIVPKSTVGDSSTATYMSMARSKDPTYRAYGLKKLRERGLLR